MLQTACPTHPDQSAQDACSRCGSYACSQCLAPGLRREALCLSCEAVLAEQARRPIQTSARFLRLVLASYAVTELLLVGVHVLGRGTPQPRTPEQIAQTPLFGLSALLAALAFLLFLAGGVTWCVWFRRANGSLQKREMQLEFGPNGWGWFFAPIANLYVPLRSVVELYTRATNTLVAPRLFVIWWALYIARAVTAWTRVTDGGLSLWGALCSLIASAAAIGAAMAVKEVTRVLAGPPPGPELAEFAPALGNDFA